MVAWGGMRGFSDEIRSMSGRYASYWNAFLLFDYLLFYLLLLFLQRSKSQNIWFALEGMRLQGRKFLKLSKILGST